MEVLTNFIGHFHTMLSMENNSGFQWMYVPPPSHFTCRPVRWIPPDIFCFVDMTFLTDFIGQSSILHVFQWRTMILVIFQWNYLYWSICLWWMIILDKTFCHIPTIWPWPHFQGHSESLFLSQTSRVAHFVHMKDRPLIFYIQTPLGTI